MGEDLRRPPDALAHTRAARGILTQNLLLSGAVLVALVPLAVTGVLGLAAVVASHELAEVLVIGNGIRAGRKRFLPAHPPLRASRTAPVGAPLPSTVAPAPAAGPVLLSLGATAPAATPGPNSGGCRGDSCGCDGQIGDRSA